MRNSLLFNLCTLIYFIAMVLYLAYLAFRTERVGKTASYALLAGFIVETAALGLRWHESYQMGIGRIPLTNLYESLVFFAWTVAIIYIFLERKFRLRIMGAFVSPFPFIIMIYASLTSKEIRPLIPALQSNWLTYHVVTCFLGYAAFAVAFGINILYLLKLKKEDDPERSQGGFWGFVPHSAILDEVSYKTVAIGFPLLTIGIVTGAFWANVAWGTYWSWDPKETWSLIVWLIYAAYLHARITRGWRGKKAAVLSIIGFVATLFCYLGVNLILAGLHSYGSS